MAATLRLTHKAIGAEVRRRPYDIVLDGERVGSVDMNAAFEMPVDPGRHSVQVRDGRNSSRVKTFDAADGETIGFRATGKSLLPVFLLSFRCPAWPSRSAASSRRAGIRHSVTIATMVGELPAWRRAVAHVHARSTGPAVDPALRVTMNFHPDRRQRGMPILEAMARDGCYRSQFETGTSNGGLTAFPGGARWRWESRIFGGAYDDTAAAQRPKYGSLNFRRRTAGGSPRFGSAHLRLTREILARTTFCYPDSFLEPTNFGVASRMPLIELPKPIARTSWMTTSKRMCTGRSCWIVTSRHSSWTPASKTATSPRQPRNSAVRWSGIPDSGSVSPRCGGTRSTAGLSSWN